MVNRWQVRKLSASVPDESMRFSETSSKSPRRFDVGSVSEVPKKETSLPALAFGLVSKLIPVCDGVRSREG